jgi:predicted molibdopterin-dependent oxidoreductase YjgC
MPTDSLFEPLAGTGADRPASVEIIFNGEQVQLPAAASVAAALLAGGIKRFRRSPVSAQGRAPYCMMGACFECLLEIDGVPDRRACLVALTPHMKIRTQDSLPESDVDNEDPALALAQAMESSHGK